MAKRQDQTVTRQEFKALDSKVDHIDKQFKALEARDKKKQARDEKQQKYIEEILNILNTSKGLASFIKMIGAITASLSAIIYAIYNLKGWLKQ
ncbi:hypothetical protein CKC_02780 [Candidatus Liberibacter solanacearum CLso-ZC1]|uniref:Transmembrane protein n=2 Tax=Candidatus Liberibacter solanacearum TaxID=556287 RepID=E4UD65_LIBSC|nr:hypothetical protein CKC_02780 [Candidatus Liberibacter solanacearum CLso-ZC1]